MDKSIYNENKSNGTMNKTIEKSFSNDELFRPGFRA